MIITYKNETTNRMKVQNQQVKEVAYLTHGEPVKLFANSINWASTNGESHEFIVFLEQMQIRA